MNREELIDFMARAADPMTFEWLDASPTCEGFIDAEAIRRYMSDALDSLSAAGLVIVPKEPTRAMKDAVLEDMYDLDHGMPVEYWVAMIDAALKDEPK